MKRIRIIQSILKQNGHYELALLLEGSEYEDYLIDNWNGGIGEIKLKLHPAHFVKANSMSNEDKTLLITLFDALEHNYDEINSLVFAIRTDLPVVPISNEDIVYLFVDESGDMDFSAKGSRYYMFNFLVKKRPFNLHEYISNYRYSLLERNLFIDRQKEKPLNIEAFHACEDNRYVKEEMFNVIASFEQNAIKIYAYILEKPKVIPEKRKEKEKFYINNLSYAIGRLLDKIEINTPFIIITDRLPVQKNRKKQIGALKRGVNEYLKEKQLRLRYEIFHHCSASSVNLQIIDYIGWSLFRKYEHHEEHYYTKIKKYIIDEEVMTKERKVDHYKK